ncbi:MAG TPA: FHA domain-containing protein [Kiritimatiellia bacterium]|nr:FHA domain-containing protein [Kiritimatiellia bacterium]HRZ11060.1 FHA domain-containing protein [Kiritimatiellia bacterium]HSA18633.1 FHA domain-containing protein [Kiritimatiellia bacterium]
MLYRLIVLSGPLKGRRLTVERAPTTVGRDPACSIHLDDEEVALRHAVFEHNDTGLVVRDLGTMNRVLVNKREVREAHLRHGDEIEIGRTRFLVQALLQTEVEAPAEEEGEPRRGLGATPRVLLLLLLFLALFIAYQRWAAQRTRPTTAFRPPVETPAVAPSNVPAPIEPPALPPQMEEELRSMRATLATIKETVEDLGTRTAMPPAAPVSPAVPSEPPVPSPDYTAWLAIESVEQVKLPQDDSPDEARLLRLRLRAAPGVTIEPDGVRMEVQLFIREEETLRIFPARVEVLVSPPEFHDGVLTNGGSAIATMQCRVPGAAGRLGRYYGFRLKLFYKDVLQAEVDRPRTLAADLWRETDGELSPD